MLLGGAGPWAGAEVSGALFLRWTMKARKRRAATRGTPTPTPTPMPTLAPDDSP